MRALVVDTYEWFKRIVSERRALSGDALATVSDGRVSVTKSFSLTVVADTAEADLRPAPLPRARGSSRQAARGTLERDLSSPVFAFLGVALVAEGFLRERQRGRRRASTTRATPP